MIDLTKENWAMAISNRFDTDLEAISRAEGIAERSGCSLDLSNLREGILQGYRQDLVSGAVDNALNHAIEVVSAAIHRTHPDWCWNFGEDPQSDNLTRQEARSLLRDALRSREE